jgi:trimeric autotransporter adhesin
MSAKSARRRPSAALVVASLALAIALSGTSYAAITLPRGSVGTKHLKRNAVTSPKVKDNALTGADINEVSLAKVPNADLLDGVDSTAFLGTGSAAGGDLSGTYPDPAVAANAIGSAEVADGSLNGVDTFKLIGTVTVDVPSVAASSCSALTVTVSGIEFGDLALLFPAGNFGSSGVSLYTVRNITIDDAIRYTVCNATTGAVDPLSGVWGYVVID